MSECLFTKLYLFITHVTERCKLLFNLCVETDAADIPLLLTHRCCWHTVAADTPLLVCCWHTIASLLLTHRCSWTSLLTCCWHTTASLLLTHRYRWHIATADTRALAHLARPKSRHCVLAQGCASRTLARALASHRQGKPAGETHSTAQSWRENA